MLLRATENLALFVSAVLLAAGADGVAPARIELFTRQGPIETRDGRRLTVDLKALVAAFAADAIKIPIDVNHATEIKAPKGEEAEPIGFITALEVEGERLFGRAEWLDLERAARLVRAYPYVSPAPILDRLGRTIRLKSAALVASPALGQQAALASAGSHQENTMEFLALLGLAAGATDAQIAAAIQALKDAAEKPSPQLFVAKAIHDQAITTLQATTAQLQQLQASTRRVEITALIEGALTDKKILPAQKLAYLAMCETDDGLANFRALLAATPAGLQASGLDAKKTPEGGQVTITDEDRAVMLQMGLSEKDWLAAAGAA